MFSIIQTDKQIAFPAVGANAAMLDRMRTGKFKVFKEHLDWWEEFRLLHRKDGRVVKESDDLMCATRYACMMLRHASTQSFSDRWRRDIVYPKAAYV
jgi:Terminase RNaseH-like domain